MTLKQLAICATQDLAFLIHNGDETAWKRADAIERRFRIQGATEHRIEAWKKQRAAFLKAESRKHDLENPDRLTYLHR